MKPMIPIAVGAFVIGLVAASAADGAACACGCKTARHAAHRAAAEPLIVYGESRGHRAAPPQAAYTADYPQPPAAAYDVAYDDYGYGYAPIGYWPGWSGYRAYGRRPGYGLHGAAVRGASFPSVGVRSSGFRGPVFVGGAGWRR